MNFSQTMEYTKRAIPKGQFSPRDAPFNFSVFRAVVDSNHRQKDEIINLLRNSCRRNFISTLTEPVYNFNSQGNDQFVHNSGIKDLEYSLQGQIYGPNRELTEDDSFYTEGFVGEKNVDEVKRVIKEFNGTPTFAYRVNEKPKQPEHRVARFGADSVRF